MNINLKNSIYREPVCSKDHKKILVKTKRIYLWENQFMLKYDIFKLTSKWKLDEFRQFCYEFITHFTFYDANLPLKWAFGNYSKHKLKQNQNEIRANQLDMLI